MAAGDTLVGLLRTRIPHFFHRWGWAVCGRHSQSRAKARQILARYWADAELRRLPLNIRLWRHVELPALMRIYAPEHRRQRSGRWNERKPIGDGSSAARPSTIFSSPWLGPTNWN